VRSGENTIQALTSADWWKRWTPPRVAYEPVSLKPSLGGTLNDLAELTAAARRRLPAAVTVILPLNLTPTGTETAPLALVVRLTPWSRGGRSGAGRWSARNCDLSAADDPAGSYLLELDAVIRWDGGLINGFLVSLERYQASADQGVVGEGPEVDVIPSLRLPNKSQPGSADGENPPRLRVSGRFAE
jgi:hypothetical protein